MDETKTLLCPKCQKEIGEQETVTCPGCGAVYHKECWENNQGCCVETCPEYMKKQETIEEPVKIPIESEPVEQKPEMEQPNLEVQPVMVPPTVCSNCGSPIQGNEPFCAVCGQPIQMAPQNQWVDPNTGMPVDGQMQPGMMPVGNPMDPNFIPPGVPPIGMPPQKKSKKKLVIILCVVLAILLIGVGIVGYFIYSSIQAEKEKQQAIAKYKEDAYSYYSAVVTNGYQVGMLGSDYMDYWGAFISGDRSYEGNFFYSAESAIQAAQEENADEITAIESSDGIIDDLYDSLTGELPDPEDEELQKIQEVIKEAQISYDELYNTVIYISGNYITYITQLSDDMESLANSIDAMEETIPNPNDSSSEAN